MVSERSEFHFVISTISPSAPEPGRFWLDLRSSLLTLGIADASIALLSLNRSLLLWFRFFFDTEEEMNKTFWFFSKRTSPPWGG
jgi:hypothetical protein